MDDTGCIAVCRSLEELATALRLVKDGLGLSNEWCDTVGGLAVGQTNKTLGPTRYKTLGKTTLPVFLTMLGLELRVHVDPDARARMAHRYESRNPDRVHVLAREPSREILERAKPHVLKAFSKLGNEARNRMLPGEVRSEIARNASRARWSKKRKRRRSWSNLA